MVAVIENVIGKKLNKYERIIARREELNLKGKELYNQLSKEAFFANKEQKERDMEMDCIDHFFECEGYKTYEEIATFAKRIGVNRIVDIGCAYGFQSEVCLNEGLDYLGLDTSVNNFWNTDSFTYLKGHYPCKLPIEKGDLGVSVLCLTWNCYLYEKDKTLKEQCEALKEDFEHCILYLPKEMVGYVSNYFQYNEKIDSNRFSNLYYFSNK